MIDKKLKELDVEITITVCRFCAKIKCECKLLICPIHGLVRVKPDGVDYRCSALDCDIMRKEKELE